MKAVPIRVVMIRSWAGNHTNFYPIKEASPQKPNLLKYVKPRFLKIKTINLRFTHLA